jgi:ribosomal protein S18 acetylase RimI-like enzyme
MNQPAIAPARLRPITSADEDFLLEVYASSRTDAALLDRLPAAERRAFLQSQFEVQRAALGVRYNSDDYCLILAGDVPIGRLYVARAADGVRVLDIALLSHWRGRGIGTFLLERILAEASEAGVPVALEVHESNRAQTLYERLGFRFVRQMGLHRTLVWGAPGAEDEPAAKPSPVAPGVLQELTAAQFATQIGTIFSAGPIPLVLQEVEELPPRRSSPFRKTPGFSLLFCGPSDPVLAQGCFDLAHEVLGTHGLFLVPVRADASAAFYQVTIN